MNATASRMRALAFALAALVTVTGPALAEDAALKGMIVAKDGAIMVVRSGDHDTPLVLTPATKIEALADTAGGQREQRPATDLVRGLQVEVTTTEQDGRRTASRISFKTSDLKLAQQATIATPGMDTRANSTEEPSEGMSNDRLRSMIDAHVRQP